MALVKPLSKRKMMTQLMNNLRKMMTQLMNNFLQNMNGDNLCNGILFWALYRSIKSESL